MFDLLLVLQGPPGMQGEPGGPGAKGDKGFSGRDGEAGFDGATGEAVSEQFFCKMTLRRCVPHMFS